MSTQAAENNQFSLFRFIPMQRAGLLLALLGCIIYINTIGNKYALDDELVVNNNRYVLQGIDGIGSIFTTDMFDSYFKDYQTDQPLSGGRYRPLSMVTFAIEYELFGAMPAISHFINMLLYGVLVLLIFQVLTKSFRIQADVAFLTTLLFAVHPIHTEVVANIKSRDEILSLIFIMLTFRYVLLYVDTGKMKYTWYSALAIFLAFFSKEYAYVVIPMALVGIHIFRRQYSRRHALVATLVLAAVAVLYTYIRYSVVGLNVIRQNDILNNPYLLATPDETLATKIFVLLKYILLLVFPAQLSADYSFKQIPYYNFGSPLVWTSIIVHAGLVAIAVHGILKRKIAGFAAAWYLSSLLLVGNLLIDIGATMGERLVFHGSLGFCMLLAVGIVWLYRRFSLNYKIVAVFVGIIAIVASARTLARNPDWYNSDVLFIHDVKVVPNSVLANANASSYCIETSSDITDSVRKKELLIEGRAYAAKAVKYYPEFTNALINYGLAEYLLGNIDSALVHFLHAKKTLATSPYFKRIAGYFYDKGMAIGKANVPEAIFNLSVACKLDSVNAPAWTNLGGAYFTVQKFDSAQYCWQVALAIDPQNAEARQGYDVIQQMRK